MSNIALLLASGTGSRCGLDYPKQFASINGKTILEHSINVFETHSLIDEIIIVTGKDYLEKVKTIINNADYKKVSKVVTGGETRKDSSYNGINAITALRGKVLIHDAVRPLISKDIITNCINSLDDYNAVCVAIESTDTIFVTDSDGNIESIPKRKFLKRAQTPQCFNLSVIKEAHQKANLDKDCLVTDDCGLIMNYTNYKIHIVEGSNDNIKVTYLNDLEFVKSKL